MQQRQHVQALEAVRIGVHVHTGYAIVDISPNTLSPKLCARGVDDAVPIGNEMRHALKIARCEHTERAGPGRIIFCASALAMSAVTNATRINFGFLSLSAHARAANKPNAPTTPKHSSTLRWSSATNPVTRGPRVAPMMLPK